MIKSSVTISLVDEARGGPFVFWDDLEKSCQQAEALGFDAVEVFAPSPDAMNATDLRKWLESHGLELAGLGTGAGWVIHRLTLTSADASIRTQARDFVRSIIDFGGPFHAPAVIGSMQGSFGEQVDRNSALQHLRQALNDLGEYAKRHQVPLIYEPLNRYETNLVNTISAGVDLINSLSTDNVKLLADLFHMNIEETNVADALRAGRGHIGHVHFVDSNRQAAGRGHTDFAPIAKALREIEYHGYASAEAFPLPDPDTAARTTIETFGKYFR